MNAPGSRVSDRLPPLVALQHRNFRLLWSGTLISMGGSLMRQAAILWHVSLLAAPGQKALALGGVGLARAIPIVICSLFAGVAADAFDRRRLMLVTNTVIKQFQQDGTFRITTEDKADAVLRATVTSVGRSPARFVRGNVLATTEFVLGLGVSYTLVGKDGKPLAGAAITGGTSFFVGADVTTEERQALPLAAEDLAVRLVSQLSEGW